MRDSPANEQIWRAAEAVRRLTRGIRMAQINGGLPRLEKVVGEDRVASPR